MAITFNFPQLSLSLPLCVPTATASSSLSLSTLRPVTPPAVSFSKSGGRGRGRGRSSAPVTRAAAAATSGSYLFALVFPLSLLAVTTFTSIKIADKLDKDFLEDLAINQAIREADEEDGDEFPLDLEEIVQESVLPRTRNRPKREI